MKECKEHRPHNGCEIFLTLAMTFLRRREMFIAMLKNNAVFVCLKAEILNFLQDKALPHKFPIVARPP